MINLIKIKINNLLLLIDYQRIFISIILERQINNKIYKSHMHSYSLADSPSSAKLDKQISQSQVTKQYLEKQNDKLIDTLNELIKESDPKERYGQIVAKRTKEINELKEDNRKLFQENRQLSKKLHNANEQIKRLYNNLDDGENGAKMEVQSPPSAKNSSSSQSGIQRSASDRAFPPQYQRQAMQAVENMQRSAQQLSSQEQQVIRKCIILLQIAFEKLNRMAEFQKVSPTTVQRNQQGSFFDKKEMVIIEREKYEKLIDYYVQSVVIYDDNKQNPNNVQQFSVNSHNQLDTSQLKSMLTNAQDFEKLFTKIAQEQKLQKQWQQYLTYRKQQGQKFKQQIEQIFKGDKKDQQTIYKDINLMNTTVSTFISNSQHNNDTLSKQSLGIIKSAQNQIEDILFKKLNRLIQKLQLTDKQKELFKQFDQRRKCGRFFDIQQFLQKFKNKQDVTEISEQYSLLMLKVINSIIMKSMEILCDQSNASANNVLQETPLRWLKSKLDSKFISNKKRLFEVIQKQSSQFLTEKHQNINLTNEQKLKNRKLVQPLPNPKFDQNKQLQKQLIKVVNQYKEVLQSSVLNSNKKILVGIL